MVSEKTLAHEAFPLVSVVIPCRNYGVFLPDTLDSIANSSYRPIEIVIANDGSTDNTSDIVSSFESDGVEVIYLKLNGVGLSAARNASLDRSRGAFVVFLDADDILEANALTDLVGCILSENADFVVGLHRNFSDIKDPIRDVIHQKKWPFSDSSYANIILHRPVPSAFIMRRNAVRFDLSVKVSELLDFLLALGLERPRTGRVCSVVTGMRQHDTEYRISNKYEHFEPLHRLEIVKRWRPLYTAQNDLPDDMRAALDCLTLTLVIEKYRRGYSIDPVVDDIDLANLRSMGIAARSWKILDVFGARLGIRILRVYEGARRTLGDLTMLYNLKRSRNNIQGRQ